MGSATTELHPNEERETQRPGLGVLVWRIKGSGLTGPSSPNLYRPDLEQRDQGQREPASPKGTQFP